MFSLQGMSFVPESNEKPIKAVLEFYPNYAGHLLGVAQIGYNSSYSKKYKESILPQDLKYLRKHADLLQWSEGDEGILSYFFLTFPGYINPATKQELADYLKDLNTVVAQHSFDDFKDKYSTDIKELDLWSGFNENPIIYDYAEEIQMISKILMNNYDTFRDQVWPDNSDYMERLSIVLNQKFEEWNLIERWEELTGMEFKAEKYNIALSNGMENGPTGKSLGYEKDWYYYDSDPAEMIHNICQEAGIKILSGLCSDKYHNYNPAICFEVYKALSHYLTDQILEDIGIPSKKTRSSLASSDLYSIFDLLWMTNPDLDVRGVYDMTLATYDSSRFAINLK